MAGRTGRKSNGEGNVRQRANGLWEARIILEGGKSKSYYGATKAEALKKLRTALNARDRGLPVLMDERQTLGHYLPSWLESKKRLEPSTRIRYRIFVERTLIPELGRVQLAKLTPQHLQRLYAKKLDDGWSPTTVNHLHTVLHGALEQAVRWGLIARNVSDLVDAPRIQRKEMRFWTPEQARTFLAAVAGDRLEALFRLALDTGMREGELFGLRWRDVDIEGGALYVQTALKVQEEGGRALGRPKTEYSRRKIEFGEGTADALRAHRKRQNEERLALGAAWVDHDIVFANTLGGGLAPNNMTRRHFLPAIKRAGVPIIRPHDMRHTAATLMLLGGVPVKVVSERLGHASPDITLRLYAHVLPGMQKDAAAVMDRLLG
ncbi:MAG TPA: tyrosine-type recombinase/integrase [Ktedonobacterales bacterium]|jgi:integrase